MKNQVIDATSRRLDVIESITWFQGALRPGTSCIALYRLVSEAPLNRNAEGIKHFFFVTATLDSQFVRGPSMSKWSYVKSGQMGDRINRTFQSCRKLIINFRFVPLINHRRRAIWELWYKAAEIKMKKIFINKYNFENIFLSHSSGKY